VFKSALEDKSLNLPSHRIVLAAVPARAANANENNIADDLTESTEDNFLTKEWMSSTSGQFV
jgi:hypothetical protein